MTSSRRCTAAGGDTQAGPPLGVAGIVFALVWAYCWYVKYALERPPKR